MIRKFCDVCGEEITAANAPKAGTTGNRVEAEVPGLHGPLRVEVMTAVAGVWHAGDVCKYCVIDAVKAADDGKRPKK